VRTRRSVDVHFRFLLLGFSRRRWIDYGGLTFLLLDRRFYDRSVTFFLFCGRINGCLLLLASYKQRKETKEVNIPCHTLESRLGSEVGRLLFGHLEQMACDHFI
jgi:hypothetical protein